MVAAAAHLAVVVHQALIDQVVAVEVAAASVGLSGWRLLWVPQKPLQLVRGEQPVRLLRVIALMAMTVQMVGILHLEA